MVLNFENIGSPYYSQTEANLSRVLEAVRAIPNAVLFIDEAEAFFPSRYFDTLGGVQAAVGNKLLATFLKWLDGVGGATPNAVILASNRAAQLDPALLSRCAGTVEMPLPSEAARALIWRAYAKQLPAGALAALAGESDGLSGRDIKKVCEVAERRFLAEAQRGGVAEAAAVTPPPLAAYKAALEDREGGLLASGGGGAKGAGVFSKWKRRRGGGGRVEGGGEGEESGGGTL